MRRLCGNPQRREKKKRVLRLWYDFNFNHADAQFARILTCDIAGVTQLRLRGGNDQLMAGAWIVEMQGMRRYLFAQRQQLLLIAHPNRDRAMCVGAIRACGNDQIKLSRECIDLIEMQFWREIGV